MANFFNEERIKCECGSELFEEVQSYMLLKEKNTNIKVPYKNFHKCISCGVLIEIKE